MGPARVRFMIADAVGVLAFTILGLRTHLVAQTPPAVLRTVGPLWVAWLAIGVWRGAYRAPFSAGLFQTWILAVPLGLVARQLLLGRPIGPRFLVFVGVALVMTLPCVAVARLVAARLDAAR